MSGSEEISWEGVPQAIIESLSDALIFADCDGVIRLWNAGAQALFGFGAEEAIGQSLDLIIPEPLRKAHWEGYRRALAQGTTVHGRVSMVTKSLHKNGGQLYVDMSFAVVKNAKGEVIGSTAVARDATRRHLEEKNLRRQLADHANKAQ